MHRYRVTGDWHGGKLAEHFTTAHVFESLIGRPSFPDLDILTPYGLATDPLDAQFRFQVCSSAINIEDPIFRLRVFFWGGGATYIIKSAAL